MPTGGDTSICGAVNKGRHLPTIRKAEISTKSGATERKEEDEY
jgi:hypothetical protein